MPTILLSVCLIDFWRGARASVPPSRYHRWPRICNNRGSHDLSSGHHGGDAARGAEELTDRSECRIALVGNLGPAEWAVAYAMIMKLKRRSAGLLVFRVRDDNAEVLLVHPGGPFWARRDEGAWSIPKGLVEEGEDELAAATRELCEEIGVEVEETFIHLGEFRQPGGKTVTAWSVEADPEVDLAASPISHFEMEWPPRSGQMQSFPEVDRVEWFRIADAMVKLHKGQRPLLEAFQTTLKRDRVIGSP